MRKFNLFCCAAVSAFAILAAKASPPAAAWPPMPLVCAWYAIWCSMPQVGVPKYYSRDSYGRPSGVEVLINKTIIGTGTKAVSRILPPGFAAGGGGAGGLARGHLWAKYLGGPGNVSDNLVTVFQNPVNTPSMSKLEDCVANAALAGEYVAYQVTPIYNGAIDMPRAITIQALGHKGFQLEISLLNQQFRDPISMVCP
jgi:DNA/RNA non-specific endonuclease